MITTVKLYMPFIHSSVKIYKNKRQKFSNWGGGVRPARRPDFTSSIVLLCYNASMAKSRMIVANIYLLLMRITFKACLYISSKYRNSLYKVHKYVLHVYIYYTSVKMFPI